MFAHINTFTCTSSLPQSKKAGSFFYGFYGLNMELIQFPGNLEIWLRYDFNMTLVEDLFEPVPCRDTQAAWRKQNERLQTADFGSVSARAPCVSHIISIFFPYCFHIIFKLFPYYVHISVFSSKT